MARKLKRAAKAKAAPSPAALVEGAFAFVTDMEDDVTAVEQFATALAFIAETLDEAEGAVVQRLALTIKARAKSIEVRRGYLFQLLHPNRDHFEKAGWPGDEVAS